MALVWIAAVCEVQMGQSIFEPRPRGPSPGYKGTRRIRQSSPETAALSKEWELELHRQVLAEENVDDR